MSIIFDSRWIGQHGIGRFAMEVYKSKALNGVITLQGESYDALSILDPIKLSRYVLDESTIFFSPSYNSPLIFSKRSILTIHDLMHLNFKEYATLKKQLYYSIVVKPTIHKSPVTFTVSNFTKNEICEWAKIDESKVIVLPNGVSSGFVKTVRPYIAERPYFLFVGNSKPHKNQYRLIKAYSQSKASDEFDLFILGTQSEGVIDLIERRGIVKKIKFIKSVDENELPSLYKGAHALLFPSLYEGFGLPIVEAMSVGTPVLTSNCTAMPEIAGEAAIYVEPLEVSSIVAGIDKIAYLPSIEREALIMKGIDRSSLFSWDETRRIVDNILIGLGYA